MSDSNASLGRPDNAGRVAFAAGDAVPGLSSWVLERKLGGGGFGEVWLARHAWDRELPPRAVKFCTAPDARHRLVNHEKNVVLRVMKHAGKHPNVVPLLDCNLDGEIPWLMYEYVPGGTLASVISGWRILPDAERLARAVATLRAIAGALAAMHRFDPPLVHRDLKPQNVLMSGDAPRVTDFGIGGVAVGTRYNTAGAETAQAARLPTAVKSAGTRVYAPPEQFLGSPPDPRDDVYALGVIAYQMVLGDTASVPGSDTLDALRSRGAPAELAALVAASVAVDPLRRPPDAAAWEAALSHLSAIETVGPAARTAGLPTPAPIPARRWATPLAAAAVLVLVGGLGMLAAASGCRGSSPTTAPEPVAAPAPAPAPASAPTPAPTEPPKPAPAPNQTATNGGVNVGGNVGGSVIVNPKLTPVKISVLDNRGSATMVLKEIKNKDNPLFDALEVENQLGLIPAGTEIRVIPGEELASPNPALRFRKVEILEGEHKGKTGWVAPGAIQTREVLR